MWTLARGGGGGSCRLAGLSLHLVTSCGQLEISHGGNIHTVGIFTLWALAKATNQGGDRTGAGRGQAVGEEVRRGRGCFGGSDPVKRSGEPAGFSGRVLWGLGGSCDTWSSPAPSLWGTGRPQWGPAWRCAGTPASPRSSLAVSPSSPHPPALPQPTHPLATWACSKCGLREHRARRLPCGERPTPWPPGRGLEVQKKGARASLKRLMREPWVPESLSFSALEEGGPGVLAGQAQQLW